MPERQISREENYFEQVDGCWRGKAHRSLSPLECEYVTALFKAEIPLTAVLIGIYRTFQNFKPRNPSDRVRGIAYCVPEIYAAACRMEGETGDADHPAWEELRTRAAREARV